MADEKGKDPVEEQAKQDEAERKLAEIMKAERTFSIGSKVFSLRVPTKTEQFEASVISKQIIERLKAMKDVKFNDSALVPLLAKKRCKEMGIDYSVMARKSQIVAKIFNYIRERTKTSEHEEMLLNNDVAGMIEFYNGIREKCLTEKEVELLGDIEAIERMIASLRVDTYEHYGDMARDFYLMAKTIEVSINNEDPVKAFDFIITDTEFGKFPELKFKFDEIEFSEADAEEVYSKYKEFIAGDSPDFLSLLSGALIGGI